MGAKPRRSNRGPLRVGAAKVDVPPTERKLSMQYRGVLDKIYSRAIVVNNGQTSAALVTLDAGAVPTELWQKVRQRVEKELGIPATNIFITATHTHSAPFQMPPTYADTVFTAVKIAKDQLQPARMSYGAGLFYINVQRDMIDAQGGECAHLRQADDCDLPRPQSN